MTRFVRKGTPALPVLMLTLAACGGDGGGEWQGTVQDSAGVEVVTSTGNGMWGPGEAWTVEEELLIGTADGQPEYQFGQISGIDVGSDGRIYVMDQQAREVRVFGPDGAFVSTMGKPGSGPGEFSQGAGPVFVGPGDTVRVPDIVQQRVSLFTADGEPAGSYPLPMTEGIAAKWMETPDQELVHQSMVMQLPGQQEVEQKNLILRRNSAGEVVDTLMEMPIGRQVSFSGGQPDITLFAAEPAWALGPDGRLYTGSNDHYSINAYGPDGALQRIIRKETERRPVTESDQEEYRRVMRKMWQDQGLPAPAVEMMSEAVKFADFYPAYINLQGGPDGTLWVQEVQTPDDVSALGGSFNIQDMGGPTWEVFDADGRLLGAVRLPDRFTPVLFRDDAIYGVLRDELDVQYAARFGLRRAGDTAGE